MLRRIEFEQSSRAGGVPCCYSGAAATEDVLEEPAALAWCRGPGCAVPLPVLKPRVQLSERLSAASRRSDAGPGRQAGHERD